MTGRPNRRAVRRARAVAALLVVLAAVAAACVAPPGTIPQVRTRHATVPAVPVAPLRSMRVDPAAIEAAACHECAQGAGDRDRFFSGRLALAALDRLLEDPATPQREELGGNLFVSGYFGGIQLRSVLGSIGVGGPGPAAPLFEWVGRATAPELDRLVGDLQTTAATGSDAQVRDAAAGLLPVLATLYGYNLGYLRQLLDHPPAGGEPAGDRITCATRWSCRTPGLGLATAGGFDPSFARLASPPDAAWATTSAVASFLLDLSEPAGGGVWAGLLSGDGFDPAGYAAIVDLSGAFLQVGSVALAGAAEASAGGEPDLARRSLALTAGLVAWAGSYFLGLASPLPDTALPQLQCAPGRMSP